MTYIRLELNKLQIHRPKERWNLYFVLVADHPEEQNQLVLTIIPQRPFLVVPEQQNVVLFEPKGKGSEGLLLLSRDLPTNRELNVHFYVMHSRRSNREIGSVLQHIKTGVGKKALGISSDLLGISAPWLQLARNGLPLIGRVLSGIPDRNLGFVNMFERFGPEFESETEVDRESRGGHVTVVYTWSVVQ